MIQFNGENNIQEIHYNGRDIRKVYDYQGKVWEKRPPDYPNEYLTIRVLEKIYTAEGCDILFHRSSGCTVELKYSVNNGEWNTLTTSAITGLLEGDVVRFKGHVISQTDASSIYGSFGRFEPSLHNVEVEGNIMSLLYEDNFSGQTDLMYPWIFCSMFSTDEFVNAENLILPSTTLTYGCYNHMLSGCRKLTKAPQLPATTLAEYCYAYMFYNCENLTYIECNARDISARNCTSWWVENVAANGTFKTPSTTNWSSGIDGIPQNWTRVDL